MKNKEKSQPGSVIQLWGEPREQTNQLSLPFFSNWRRPWEITTAEISSDLWSDLIHNTKPTTRLCGLSHTSTEDRGRQSCCFHMLPDWNALPISIRSALSLSLFEIAPWLYWYTPIDGNLHLLWFYVWFYVSLTSCEELCDFICKNPHKINVTNSMKWIISLHLQKKDYFFHINIS